MNGYPLNDQKPLVKSLE